MYSTSYVWKLPFVIFGIIVESNLLEDTRLGRP